jgi:ribonuclease P protein component
VTALPDPFTSRSGTPQHEPWCAPLDPEDVALSVPRPASGLTAVRFPKSSKLLRHADFQRVYKQGRRHFAAHMTVFYLRRENIWSAEMPMFPTWGPRVGLTVGRVLGGSVVRNRIKRRLREAVRYNLASLPLPVDVVINPKKSAQAAEFSVLKDEVARAFQVIREKGADQRGQQEKES